MKQRILETADRLFYRRGIHAVGVDTIAAEAGISKRSLYDHFPSKDALILAYLDRRARPFPASDAPPAAQILAVFDRLEAAFRGEAFRGCPFVNAVAELGEPDHAARHVAACFKEQRRNWFRDRLREAGAADPERLAPQIQVLMEGAIAVALVRCDPAAAGAAREAARVLMRAAGIGLPG